MFIPTSTFGQGAKKHDACVLFYTLLCRLLYQDPVDSCYLPTLDTRSRYNSTKPCHILVGQAFAVLRGKGASERPYSYRHLFSNSVSAKARGVDRKVRNRQPVAKTDI